MPQESRNTFSPQEGNLCFLFICNKKPSVSFHYAHVVGSFSSSTKREGEEGIQAKTPLAIVLYDTEGTVFFGKLTYHHCSMITFLSLTIPRHGKAQIFSFQGKCRAWEPNQLSQETSIIWMVYMLKTIFLSFSFFFGGGLSFKKKLSRSGKRKSFRLEFHMLVDSEQGQ